MYDMYPWDAHADSPRNGTPGHDVKHHDTKPHDAKPHDAKHHDAKHQSGNASLATAAVQFALDRRDNGGEAQGSYPGQEASAPAARK